MPGKEWNWYEYMLATEDTYFAMKTVPNSKPEAQSNADILKWEQLPDWEIVIQTHLLRSIPPHLPRGADKGPICVIKYAEPKYNFSHPKMPPDERKSAKQ